MLVEHYYYVSPDFLRWFMASTNVCETFCCSPTFVLLVACIELLWCYAIGRMATERCLLCSCRFSELVEITLKAKVRAVLSAIIGGFEC